MNERVYDGHYNYYSSEMQDTVWRKTLISAEDTLNGQNLHVIILRDLINAQYMCT